jgi:hypothetical protein
LRCAGLLSPSPSIPPSWKSICYSYSNHDRSLSSSSGCKWESRPRGSKHASVCN